MAKGDKEYVLEEIARVGAEPLGEDLKARLTKLTLDDLMKLREYVKAASERGYRQGVGAKKEKGS